MEKNDLNSVIAGLAGLGEIYLRISDKIRSLYEEDPKLKFEAELLMAKAGYAKAPLMKDLVDDLLGLHSAFASSMSDRILLRTYGDKFNDIVLLQETVNEFAAAGDEKRRLSGSGSGGSCPSSPIPILAAETLQGSDTGSMTCSR